MRSNSFHEIFNQNRSSCISLIKHAVMLRVGCRGCKLEFSAALSAQLFTMMLKLTLHWIVFPSGLQLIFLSAFSAREAWLSFHGSQSQTGLLMLTLCSAGVMLAVTFTKREMARGAELPNVSHRVWIWFLFRENMWPWSWACIQVGYCNHSFTIQDSLKDNFFQGN